MEQLLRLLLLDLRIFLGSDPVCRLLSSQRMDSDLWISRLAAAKRHCLLQKQQSSHSGLLPLFLEGPDRFDVDEYLEEEVRPEFPCPFYYKGHDITSLCSHLQD